MSLRSKWILGIIGTLILGALGSGLWDLCLRGIFIWIGHGVLTLITLGLGSIRDSIYVDIAQGRTDRVGIYLVAFGMAFLGGLTGFIIARIGIGRQLPNPQSPEGRSLRWVVVLALVFALSTFWFRFAVISYSTRAVEHFEQVYTICLPFMSAADRDSIRSEFARIKSKADYVAVIGKLQDKADKNNVKLPTFSVW